MEECLKGVRTIIRLILGVSAALGILALTSSDSSVFDRALAELELIKRLDISEYATKIREFRSNYATIRLKFPYEERSGQGGVSKWFLFERLFRDGFPTAMPEVNRLRTEVVTDSRLVELDDVFSIDTGLRGPLRFVPDYAELSRRPNILEVSNSSVDGVVGVKWPIRWYAQEPGPAVVPVELQIYSAERQLLRLGESIQDLYWQHVNSFRERQMPIPHTLARKAVYPVPGIIERDEDLAFVAWSGASGLVEQTDAGLVLFPNLKTLWGHVATKTPDEAEAIVQDMKKAPTRDVNLLGFSVAGRDALVVGPILLIGLFLYLILNLAHARRLTADYPEMIDTVTQFPIVLLFTGRFDWIGRIVVVALIPMCAQVALLQRFSPVVGELYGTPVVFCIVSTLLAVFVLVQARLLRRRATARRRREHIG